MAKSKINTWLSHIWQMNRDESDKILCEIRSFLFQFRNNAEKEYRLIEETIDEEVSAEIQMLKERK